ncbi:hypothetical protein BH23ACT5_BH23ACT5_16980 [soil metagenome]
MKHRYSFVVLVIGLVSVFSACNGDGTVATTSTAPDTTTPQVTTTSQATTTTSSSTTTTPEATTTSGVSDTTTTSTATDTNSLADGTGCTPGTDDLPDGEWYGIVVDTHDDEIDFDLACWFSGEAAEMAAAGDGTEVNNDYYVRNVNPQIREIDVADDAVVVWLTNLGSPQDTQETDFATWLTARAERGESSQPAVWITVEDEEVVLITEQWVP